MAAKAAKDGAEESPTMKKYGRYCVNLALFSVALPLITGSVYSKQKQNSGTGNYGASEAPSVPPTAERGGNSKDISPAKVDPGLVVPSLEDIVARMSQAAIRNAAHFRPYIVTREYELFVRERDNARSRVIATITFLPPDSRNYSVRRAEGSALGEMIVRRVLGREASIAKGKGSSDITPDNYNFQFVGEETVSGHHCYLLRLFPRRKDTNLLRGTVWVDTDSYLIRRIEGDPDKSPSWWARDVHVVLIFSAAGGMWLPTSSEYTARVRLLGPSAMRAHDLRYSYPQFGESENGLIEKPSLLPGISASFSSRGKEAR